MAREDGTKVEGTNITLKGKDQSLARLTAKLAAPNDESKGMSVPAADSLAKKLQNQDLSLEQVKFVQEKKDFKHPSEAAKWLLEADNKLILFLWEQDLEGGPVKEHTS